MREGEIASGRWEGEICPGREDWTWSGSWGRGLDVSVAARRRRSERWPEVGGGERLVERPFSSKEMRFGWLAKLASSSISSSVISSGMMSDVV
jgi:hypothetical protein